MPAVAGERPANAAWILATTILASSLAFIDGSVVNVALPAIGRSLNDRGAALAWVLTGYLLPLTALLLIGGAAGDRYGRRRLLIIGTVLFAAASLLCALSRGLPSLLIGRILQGIGAALVMPNSLAILGATFSGEERGRAIGIWAGVGAAAGALGPLVGGWLVDTVGWRAIFLINLPIAASAIAIAWRYVPDEAEPERAPLDIAGGALASAALALLTWALIEWSASRHADGLTLAALAAGAVASVVFIAVERRIGDRAMLPLALFESLDFVGLSLLTLLLYGALGGLLVLIPYVLIETGDYSGAAAGAALLPLPLVIAFTSTTMGRIAGKVGSRLPLVIGPCVTAVGCLLALRIGQAGSYWTTTFPALLVISIGMAGAVAPLTTAVLAAVPSDHAGVASGFNSAIARGGGLIATALLGGVLALQGSALAEAFKFAALAAGAAALAAGLCALAWVGRSSKS